MTSDVRGKQVATANVQARRRYYLCVFVFFKTFLCMRVAYVLFAIFERRSLINGFYELYAADNRPKQPYNGIVRLQCDFSNCKRNKNDTLELI